MNTAWLLKTLHCSSWDWNRNIQRNLLLLALAERAQKSAGLSTTFSHSFAGDEARGIYIFNVSVTKSPKHEVLGIRSGKWPTTASTTITLQSNAKKKIPTDPTIGHAIQILFGKPVNFHMFCFARKLIAPRARFSLFFAGLLIHNSLQQKRVGICHFHKLSMTPDECIAYSEYLASQEELRVNETRLSELEVIIARQREALRVTSQHQLISKFKNSAFDPNPSIIVYKKGGCKLRRVACCGCVEYRVRPGEGLCRVLQVEECKTHADRPFNRK